MDKLEPDKTVDASRMPVPNYHFIISINQIKLHLTSKGPKDNDSTASITQQLCCTGWRQYF